MADGSVPPERYKKVDVAVAAARDCQRELRVYDDALTLLAEVRDAGERT